MIISYFDKVQNNRPSEEINLDGFLNDVKNGRWQDQILKLRTVPIEADQKQLKKKLPAVTISGTFKVRKASSLLESSGFIAMDIDDIEDVERLKKLLELDTYVYSFFHSCRGNGLCVLFKTDPQKHLESFLGLQSYFWERYQQPIDPSGKDVSRARFVSYDPFLYCNPASKVFKQYPKKKKQVPKTFQIVTTSEDFDFVVDQINNRALDITGDYEQWLQIGFSIYTKLGDSGKNIYQAISQHSPKYDHQATEKQWKHICRHQGKGITIATFFYFAKQYGVEIVSEQTKKAASLMQSGKRTKISKEDAIKTAIEYGNISKETAEDVAKQVYDENVQPDKKDDDLTEIEKVEIYLQQFGFRFNELSRLIETRDGTEIEDQALNDLWRDVSKILDHSNFSANKIIQVLTSSYSPKFHPLKEFFETNETTETGLIKKLVNTIPTDTGFDNDNFHPELVEKFITKWLVSMVASVYGHHSPLMLVLTGGLQGTGKTQFFRRLLPEPLQKYYAETKFAEGKDDLVLMCRKWLVLCDEYSGKTLKDEKAMKEILSKQTFNIREPYARRSIDQKRIAVMAATSNETEVLNDPTGNRRFVCVHVTAPINWEAYNNINKTALFMEAYSLFKSGYDYHILGDEINELSALNSDYYDTPIELDLFYKFYAMPYEMPGAHVESLTLGDIVTVMKHHSNISIDSKVLQKNLKRERITPILKKINGRVGRYYNLVSRLND